MDERDALAFIEEHGVVMMSARGPVPNLAEAIAGEPIRGSWWGHPKSQQIYVVLEAVRDSSQVLVCRLVGGKVTFVHRRLWPALVRLAGRLPRAGLAAIREEHTASGRHRTVARPFPRWVPRPVLDRAARMSEGEAVAEFEGVTDIGVGLLSRASGPKTARSRRGAGAPSVRAARSRRGATR